MPGVNFKGFSLRKRLHSGDTLEAAQFLAASLAIRTGRMLGLLCLSGVRVLGTRVTCLAGKFWTHDLGI